MSVFVATALKNIEFDCDLGRGEWLDDNTLVTNAVTNVHEYLDSTFEKFAGTLETEFLKSSQAIVYSRVDALPPGLSLSEFSAERLNFMSRFLVAMWLVRDNAIEHDTMFVALADGAKVTLHTREMARNVSRADGSETSVRFSRAELRRARRMLREQFDEWLEVGSGASVAMGSVDRFSRSTYFAQAARATHDVGLKIANYCTALEALFSTSTSEVTHSLSERTAAVLEDEPQPKWALYRDLRKAYELRSIVVHGSGATSSKASNYQATASHLDDVLRRIFLRFLDGDLPIELLSEKDSKLGEILTRKVFGESWEALLAQDSKS